MRYGWLIVGLLLAFSMSAQVIQQLDVPVTIDGNLLKYGFNGGTNNPQLHRTDLNNDGILDLYYFDKIGNVSMTYIYDNSGDLNYEYAPSYGDKFPDLQRFVLLRDYDGDGIDDLFALDGPSGGAGMQVHKGKYLNDTLSFDRVNFCCNTFNVIYYEGNSSDINLLVPSTDYPAIEDMDGDGDLDILTFSQAGFKVDYFENQSVERGFGLDSLQFVRADDCWGRFAEQGLTEVIDLGADANSCASNFTSDDTKNPQNTGQAKHAGSTISIQDINGDGIAEVFLGDISYSNVTQLDNGGASTAQAWMVDQDNSFPSYDVPVDIPFFPATFFLDLDNDGLKDFIAASHIIGNTEDYNSVWFYKNVGTASDMQFSLQSKSTFVDASIDLGTGNHPCFVDENADGLLDIVVGNFTYFTNGGGSDSRLFLFRNTGTASDPAFTLVDDNYLDFRSLNSTEINFSPTFGDIDMDGDLDLMVGAESGKLHFCENTAGANNPMDFGPIQESYLGIDIGVAATPFLIDLNDDEFADLLVGERSGSVNLFLNNGAGAGAHFETIPDDGFFGMFDVRESNGFGGRSTPAVIEVEDELQFFSGSESGNIFQYNNVDIGNNTSNLVTDDYGKIHDGWNAHPALADINNDGKVDLLIGNQRGGMTLYTTSLVSHNVSVTDIDRVDAGIQIYPNPSSALFNISLLDIEELANLKVYNVAGQLIKQQSLAQNSTIDLSGFADGIYIFKMATKKGIYSKRVLKTK